MERSRYSCQVALPGFGEAAQQRLRNARILIVGAGGLGCPAAQYLVASGAGTIGLVDFDTVTVRNLHRQILYTADDAGRKKVEVACERLRLQNPDVTLVTHDLRLDTDNIMETIAAYDVVLDCTDNFESRYLINDACVLAGKPVVYGAIYQYEGQVAVWNVKNEDGSLSPNYRDLFPDVNAAMIPNCADGGVLPTLAGIIGCMQANEAIKLVTATGENLAGKLLIFDAANMHSRVIGLGKTTSVKITSLPNSIQIPLINYEVLQADINAYELVDVRTTEEREQKNIGGLHIPISDIETNTSFLLSGKPVVLYCASGKRSAEAAKIIKRLHPAVVIFSLSGGI